MKQLLLCLSVGLFIVLTTAMASHTEGAFGKEETGHTAHLHQGEGPYAEIRVDGLSCPFCVTGLRNKLNEVEALEIIDIDYKKGIVHAKWDESTAFDEASIKQAVRDSGFTPRQVVYPAKIKI